MWSFIAALGGALSFIGGLMVDRQERQKKDIEMEILKRRVTDLENERKEEEPKEEE